MPEENQGEEKEGGNEKEKEPEPVYTQEKLEELLADRIPRERERLKKELQSDLRAQLLADDAFRREALKEWDVKPAKEVDQLDDEKVQELYQTWEEKNVQPLKEKEERLASEVTKLRTGQLESEILSAGRGLVQEGLLKRQANGRTALFNMIGGEFTYDEESGEWRVKGDKDDFRPSPSGDRLYMTPEEYIRSVWAEDQDNAPFVRDKTQGGSDYQGSKGSGGKRTYTRDEYAKLCDDEDYYAKHRDELLAAEREGRVKAA